MRRRLRRPSQTACAAAYTLGTGMLLVGASARAACPLALVPADAPPAWASAARTAADRLASAPSYDCSSVEIAVRPSGGALLTFITTSGRRAVRALLSPEEVAPALEALVETLPSDPVHGDAAPPPPPVEPRPRSSSPEASALLPSLSAVPVAPQAPSTVTHFILGVSVGARFGFAGVYASPAVALRPSGTFGPWELAATVEYDPSYAYLPGGLPQGFKLWSFITGVHVGRREALGAIALGYGLGLGVASIRQDTNDTGAAGTVVDFGQPRATLYARVVVPRRASVRATFDLDVDAALANFKKAEAVRNGLPELPRWGILVSGGVETSAL